MESLPDDLIDNNRADHRQALISALKDNGFAAYEYHSGGGTFHVVVDVNADRTGLTEDILQITTGSIDSLCDVGLMGWRNGANVQSDTWRRTATFQDAADAFLQYWEERDEWLRRFEAGDLDL